MNTQQPNTKETPEETFNRIKEKYFLVPLNEEGHKYWANKESLFAIVSDYHTERTCIEAQQPKKTLQQCKDEVARKYSFSSKDKYLNWGHMLEVLSTQNKTVTLDVRNEEAAELYASQFQSKVVVSDEEIEAYARKHCENIQEQIALIKFSKWIIDKLNNQIQNGEQQSIN